MSSKLGGWLVLLGGFIALGGLIALPAAMRGGADRNLLGLGMSVFAMGALTIAVGIYLKAQDVQAAAKPGKPIEVEKRAAVIAATPNLLLSSAKFINSIFVIPVSHLTTTFALASMCPVHAGPLPKRVKPWSPRRARNCAAKVTKFWRPGWVTRDAPDYTFGVLTMSRCVHTMRLRRWNQSDGMRAMNALPLQPPSRPQEIDLVTP